MKIRLILGTILIATLILALYIDSTLEYAYASLVILGFMGAGGAIEWNRMMRDGQGTYPVLLVLAAVAYPILECYRIRQGWAAGSLDGMFLFVFLLLLFGRAVLWGQVKEGLDRIGRTLLGFVLLYLFYRLVPILLDPALGGGLYAAYLLVFTSKSCDIGAYLVGRTFGKRKLIPKVSPGKTVAGGLGGLAFSTIVGGVVFSLQAGWPAWYAILFGLVMGAVTMLSDLAESLVKRCSGVKDSAALLPEMGGILDLIDSLFLAAPTGYLFHWAFQLFLNQP
jgi:CDP-diglyceride synthetase